MSNLLAVRRWERPDRPQPVYTGALSLWEAPRYVPIGDATRNSYRTADRVSDRTYVQQTAPAFSWVQPVVDGIVRTWMVAVTAEPSYRTGDGPRLEVRRFDWSPEPTGWLFTELPVTTTTAQQWPALLQNSGLSYRSDDRPRLDVRRYDWSPEFGWIYTPVSAGLATLAGALHAERLSYRVAERGKLDVRGYDWSPAFAWVTSAVASTIASWLPVFDAQVSYQPPARRALDVRGYEWVPEFGWIFNAQPPPATVAQQWPALLQNLGLSYRSDARAALDVRAHEWTQFGWVFTVPTPSVPDTTLGHRVGNGLAPGAAHRSGPIVPGTGRRVK